MYTRENEKFSHIHWSDVCSMTILFVDGYIDQCTHEIDTFSQIHWSYVHSMTILTVNEYIEQCIHEIDTFSQIHWSNVLSMTILSHCKFKKYFLPTRGYPGGRYLMLSMWKSLESPSSSSITT